MLKERVDGKGGVIMVDRTGNVGYAFNTAHMAHTYLTEGMGEPVVGV
jgi:beta-aspartyl-peptidase (threonine type)